MADLGVAESLCQPPGITNQIDAGRRHKRGNDLVVPHTLEQSCDRLVAHRVRYGFIARQAADIGQRRMGAVQHTQLHVLERFDVIY